MNAEARVRLGSFFLPLRDACDAARWLGQTRGKVSDQILSMAVVTSGDIPTRRPAADRASLQVLDSHSNIDCLLTTRGRLYRREFTVPYPKVVRGTSPIHFNARLFPCRNNWPRIGCASGSSLLRFPKSFKDLCALKGQHKTGWQVVSRRVIGP